MANFNTLNYKKWDDHYLEINPHLSCNFKISKSRVYDDYFFNRPRRLSPIYYYLSKEGTLEVIFNRSKIPANSLENSLKKYLVNNEEPQKSVPVYLDRKVSFDQFEQFRKILHNQNINWIQIIIQDPENYYPFNNPMEKVIEYRISDYLFNPVNKKDLEKGLTKISNIIHVNLIDYQTYQINGKSITPDSLKSTLKTLIQKDTNYLIHYQYKKNITFGLYFKLFIQAKEILYEINTNQEIDPNDSEMFLYSKNEHDIPFLILEEVTE
jgi:biopolymer transport protein ExbD